MSMLETLAASTSTALQTSAGWWVRVLQLTPSQAGRARVLVELLAGLATPDKGEAKAREMTEEEEDRVVSSTARVICECVTHLSKDGETWERVHFVPEHKHQNLKTQRVWVNSIPAHVRGEISGCAMGKYIEAQGVLRPFHPGRAPALVAGQGGSEVRHETA
mgnify:FL=1|jgi:hypothetical protein